MGKHRKEPCAWFYDFDGVIKDILPARGEVILDIGEEQIRLDVLTGAVMTDEELLELKVGQEVQAFDCWQHDSSVWLTNNKLKVA